MIGFGYGPSSPAGNDILHRTAPPAKRAMIFSVKQAGVPVGGVLAGLALAPFAEIFGWRASLVAAGLFVVAVILSAQPMRATLDAGRSLDQRLGLSTFLAPANLLSPLATLTETRALFRLAAAGTCLAFCQGIWFTYLVTYGVSVMGYDLSTAGLLFAILQGMSIVARIGLGWVADRTGSPRQVLSLLGLASGVTTLAWALVGPGWAFWQVALLSAVAGVTVTSWNGVQLSEVARACPPAACARPRPARRWSSSSATWWDRPPSPPCWGRRAATTSASRSSPPSASSASRSCRGAKRRRRGRVEEQAHHLPEALTLSLSKGRGPSVPENPRSFDKLRMRIFSRPHQVPVLPMLDHGSAGAFASPFCRSSIEMPSGDLTNAMRPSRGGRLMVTPASISRWQVA